MTVAALADREEHAIALALNTAQRWFGRGSIVDNDDILGAAMLGAAKALGRFDPSRGVAFASYAISLIRGEIQEELRRWDHLSRDERQKARAEQQVTGEPPAWSAPPLSLEDLIIKEGEWGSFGVELQETVAAADQDPEALALTRIAAEEWRRIIGWLTANERAVILGHYYEGREMTEVTVALGRSGSLASELHRKALKRLRVWALEGLVTPP